MTWLFGTAGGSDPTKTFWAAESRKSGVAPARFCSLHTAAFEVSRPDTLFSQQLRQQEGEDFGTGEGAG
jgi:hypothetical protein